MSPLHSSPAPESVPPAEKSSEKPKSPQAERAVVKPKKKPAPPEESWKGGIDHFDERV